MMTIFLISFCLILLLLLSLLHKLWWTPVHIQNMLWSQGLKGPSYKFIHGNTKEITKMKKEAMAIPLDSSNHDIFSRIQPHFYSWMELYGKNFLMWNGRQPQIIVTEPELVREILSNKQGIYAKNKAQGFMKKLLGDGLVAAQGEKWSRKRKLANHAFHGESLKGMVPDMIASVESMLEKWKQYEGKEVEVWPEIKFLTSEVISRTAFGSSYEEGENIFEMLTQLIVIAARNMYSIQLFSNRKFFRSQDVIESEKIEQSLRESILQIVKKKELEVIRGEKDNFGNDFLGLLLQAHHDSDKKNRMSVQDIIDECKVFYLGGQETSNSLLSWVVLLLAIHKDWQAKARSEVLELFGPDNPTAEGIARMKIVSMIINETLRLYSPVLNITRRLRSKVKLGNYELPANVDLQIPVLAIHRDPEIWGKDAHLFSPERFAEGVMKAANGNPAVFLPFGYGPRSCVGLSFAANEAKIASSMILQRYNLTLSPNYVHSPFQLLALRPQHGVRVMLQAL